MFDLPDIFAVNQFCLRVLSALAITTCKGIVLFMLVFTVVRCHAALSPKVKHFLLFCVFAFFLLAPLFIWTSRYLNIDAFQIAQKNGSPYGSVRSVLVMNTGGSSRTFMMSRSGYEVSYRSLYEYGARLRWPFWALTLWASGVLVSVSPLLYGLAGLAGLRGKVPQGDLLDLQKHLAESKSQMGIMRHIPLIVHRRCRTPSASGVFSPKILVPEDFDRWPEEQIRTVLLHELAHIKRGDLVTQFLSRMICSIFWFLPILWLCYEHLRTEQEKSCDALTIDSGVFPVEYAGHLITLVRNMKSQAYAYTVFASRGGKRMLEKRIVTVLQMKNGPHKRRSSSVNVITMVLVCLGALLIVNPVSAEDAAKRIEPQDMFCGTWINTDYSNRAEPAKHVIRSDGYINSYATISDSRGLCGSSYVIEDTWTDADQNLWLKVRTSSDRYYYELNRISDRGNCLEYVYSPYEYPTELNSEQANYRMYFKLE
jgi:beta-lactamase regulating signal transducer with metallopeptidase domain